MLPADSIKLRLTVDSTTIKEKIVIKDIRCGEFHNVALDVNGKVYSWGDNERGQCGDGMNDVKIINPPKLIESFKQSVIDCIDCGQEHSYVKTMDDRHYLFGSNSHGQCITYNDERNVIAPLRVDEIIKTKCNATKIIEIALGYSSTFVSVSI